MDLGTAMSVAQTLLAALDCSELEPIWSRLRYKSKLTELQATVTTIKAVLRDAEDKQELTHETKIWIQELTNAVYDADDLLDEFITLSEKKKLIEGGKVSEKVSFFFSRFNPFSVACNLSRRVEEIRKRLNGIASNHSQYGFSVDHRPLRSRSKDTCSYVYAGNIIGRDDDLEKIVGMLLDSNVQRDVSFLPIVGIGGLGKTALAQIVYDDDRVKDAFKLKLWACVADQDKEQLDIEEILGQILASANNGQKYDGFTMDWVQSQVREKLTSTKYLLILDDVWTENCHNWRRLSEFFLGSHKGSWVIVTTRSKETAKIIGGNSSIPQPHLLEGLSKENSWRLFQMAAFGSEQSNPPDVLVKIGHDIVEGCARVPLAIRVVGSLLYGQDQQKWQSLQKSGLTNIRGSENNILPILKLSYHHLDSPLKSCFSYCAIFPKDFQIKKEMLVSLWLAQGYVVPLDEGQTTKDAAEEYISILLRRCFFQDIVEDVFGEIISFKMHDLMHDVATDVARTEICITSSITEDVDKKVRHLSLMRSERAGMSTEGEKRSECAGMSKDSEKRSECTKYSFTNTCIRSFLHVGGWYQGAKMNQFALEALLANCTSLRALDLSYQNIKCLPDSIGGLLHLRYLDLTGNRDLQLLPKSIKKLHNLETLKLSLCDRLKELPQQLNKLVKLRVLEMKDCYSLTHMPCGMGKMTGLQTLTQFVLRKESWNQWYDQLTDLESLQNLEGHLVILIHFPTYATHAENVNTIKGAYLMNKKHLTRINIRFDYGLWEVDRKMEFDEALMERLQPHSNLKELELYGYDGAKMPSWTSFLPNLTRLRLDNCRKLQYLPYLGDLPHLKVLDLVNLPEFEYFFEDSTASARLGNPIVSAAAELPHAEGLSFFPSLERLELHHLPKLKGWWRGVGDDQLLVGRGSLAKLGLLCVSELKSLTISSCPELSSFPLCPMVKDLSLCDYNENLRIMRISVSDITHLFRCLS